MDKNTIVTIAAQFVGNSEENYISRQIALTPQVEGMKIYDAPIFAFGSANDEYFEKLKNPSAIGKHFLQPKEWLPTANTIISFFLPYSETVKRGNSVNMSWPSDEWLHGRIEGQTFLVKLCQYLKAQLEDAGFRSVVPCLDERFQAEPRNSLNPDEIANFTSNWSERHVAFVCGLGTFGLSKGLITKKGIAGRFGSIITELPVIFDNREYEDIYEYCSFCGACAINCPADAISIDKGKNHNVCYGFIEETLKKHKPRYGCGKCQIKVPCQSGIPK